jgi:hypothetical protein
MDGSIAKIQLRIPSRLRGEICAGRFHRPAQISRTNQQTRICLRLLNDFSGKSVAILQTCGKLNDLLAIAFTHPAIEPQSGSAV